MVSNEGARMTGIASLIQPARLIKPRGDQAATGCADVEQLHSNTCTNHVCWENFGYAAHGAPISLPARCPMFSSKLYEHQIGLKWVTTVHH